MPLFTPYLNTENVKKKNISKTFWREQYLLLSSENKYTVVTRCSCSVYSADGSNVNTQCFNMWLSMPITYCYLCKVIIRALYSELWCNISVFTHGNNKSFFIVNSDVTSLCLLMVTIRAFYSELWCNIPAFTHGNNKSFLYWTLI